MGLKEFENSYWESFEQNCEFRHATALHFIKKYTIKSVLDTGSGDGYFLTILPKSVHAEALELSDVGLKKIRSLGYTAYQKDISVPLLLDKKYEALVCLDILEHVFNPSECISHIAPYTSAYLIISVPNFNSIVARFQVLLGKVPENNSPRKGHCFWFNQSVLKSILEENGFKILEIKTNSFFQNIPLLRNLLASFPSLFGLSFVLIAKKKKLP